MSEKVKRRSRRSPPALSRQLQVGELSLVLLPSTLLLLASGCGREASLVLEPSASAIPANGVSTVVVKATQAGSLFRRGSDAPLEVRLVSGQSLVTLLPPVRRSEGYAFTLQAGLEAGTVTVEARLPGPPPLSASLPIVLFRDEADDDADGFANELELKTADDRLAFRRWFTAIALAQAVRRSNDWEIVHQDCAGLLRYAYKEALRLHDASWQRAHPSVPVNTGQDVRTFHYPDLPGIGDAPFRTGLRTSPFSAAVSGQVLRDENTIFVSRDVRSAQHGDLLFYALETDHGRALHAMITLKSDEDSDLELVYHTGPATEGQNIPDGSGEVRHIRLKTLLEHPEAGWHPKADNPSFLGVYRWRILT